jgi:myosin heavy subunit
MLEFVNMCAEKIQATFRTYITRKRHLFALKKLKKFKENFCAVLKGWKTWNVFNCKKIK